MRLLKKDAKAARSDRQGRKGMQKILNRTTFAVKSNASSSDMFLARHVTARQ